MKAPAAKGGNVHQLPTAAIPPAYLAMAAAQMHSMGKQVFEQPSAPTADQLTATLKAPNASGQ